MSHPFLHFATITRHRHRVIAHCFRVGIGWQGLFHDLSKYSPTEFIPGARYYQGTRSPNERERELLRRAFSRSGFTDGYYRAKLSAMTGKKIILKNTISPEILGGVKLRYSGIQLDGSVKTRLDKFEASLKNTVI